MLEQESELGNRKLIQEAQKIEISEMKNSDGKKWKLQQEVIQLKQGLQTQVTNHRDGETTFRKVPLFTIFLLIHCFANIL